MSKELKVAIIRPSRFGIALGAILAENTSATFCFELTSSHLEFQRSREIPKYHPGVRLLSDRIHSVDDYKRGIKDADVVLVTSPMKYLRTTVESIVPYAKNKIWVTGSKGIEQGTNMRPSEVIADVNPVFNKSSYAIISGPNLAWELIRKLPAITVIASQNEALTHRLQKIFRTSYFFPYLSDDVTGVELGGALKNPMAMLVGICYGLGLGNNASAALKNRCLKEMTRLAVVLGADERTLMGAAGEADLSTSCQQGGRNYDAGVAIGRGVDPRVLQQSGQTIEAFNTIEPALSLAKGANIGAPLLEGLKKMIDGEQRPSYIINMLVEGNHHFEDPQTIIDRRLRRWVRRFNRVMHLWE